MKGYEPRACVRDEEWFKEEKSQEDRRTWMWSDEKLEDTRKLRQEGGAERAPTRC